MDFRETDPPATLDITPEVLAQCSMAGAPAPKPEHVVQFLANARQKGIRARSWSAGLVQWMVRQKNYDASRKAQDEARKQEREAGAVKPPPIFKPPKPDPNERPISREQFAALQATLGNGPAKVVEPTPARKKIAEGGG